MRADKAEIISEFGRLSAAAERRNAELKERRFWPIQTKEGRVPIFGMYDYRTKRYVLSRPFDDLSEILTQIEDLIKASR